MRNFNGKYWKEYVEKRVCPDFRAFGSVVRKRILPIFDGINQEATDLQNRRYQELVSNVVHDEDFWDAGEAMANLAFEEAAEHHEMLWSMRSATLNMYSAALYHLTEQHIVDLCSMIADFHKRVEIPPGEAIKWLRDEVGLDVKSLPSWPIIHELRLVANAVKHGEGHSAEDLHQLRPDLFVLPMFNNTDIGRSRTRVRKPLFGRDIYVSSEDFAKYHDGSVAFWTEIADALPALTH